MVSSRCACKSRGINSDNTSLSAVPLPDVVCGPWPLFFLLMGHPNTFTFLVLLFHLLHGPGLGAHAGDPVIGRVLGSHILVDLTSVANTTLLNSAPALEDLFRSAVDAGNLTLISDGIRFHQFHPIGITGVVLLAESHMSIHTWPEHGSATLDIFTCGDHAYPELAVDALLAGLQPRYKTITRLARTNGYAGWLGVQALWVVYDVLHCVVEAFAVDTGGHMCGIVVSGWGMVVVMVVGLLLLGTMGAALCVRRGRREQLAAEAHKPKGQ